jgi:hypothetical protein
VFWHVLTSRSQKHCFVSLFQSPSQRLQSLFQRLYIKLTYCPIRYRWRCCPVTMTTMTHVDNHIQSKLLVPQNKYPLSAWVSWLLYFGVRNICLQTTSVTSCWSIECDITMPYDAWIVLMPYVEPRCRYITVHKTYMEPTLRYIARQKTYIKPRFRYIGGPKTYMKPRCRYIAGQKHF